MRPVFHSIPLIFVIVLAPTVEAGDSVLDQLKLGATTPQELESLFPGTRTEIPKGDGKKILHFQDSVGNAGICYFARERLFKYTVALKKDSQGVTAVGSWQQMVHVGTSTFGEPKLKSDDYVAWDLTELYFILSLRTPNCVTVTLGNKQLEGAASVAAKALPAVPRVTKQKVNGGPYFFKGFRPDETRKVKLTEGVYSIRSRHKGRGNFAVWMYTETDEKLVANEIGYSLALYTVRVVDPVVEVLFAIEYADGPWEIHVKKVVGETKAVVIQGR